MPLVQGLGFPGGETMVEPWTFMNRKRAAEYLYTARRSRPSRRRACGLINRVVPRDELDATVERWRRTSRARRCRRSMGTKSLLVRAWEQMGMRQHLQMSADVMSIMEQTGDAQEFRRRLFEEGRKPRDVT